MRLAVVGAAVVAIAVLATGAPGTAAAGRVADAPNNGLPPGISACVRTRGASVRAVAFDGRALPFRVAGGHDPRCRGRSLRILTLQALRIGGRLAYVRRGGCAKLNGGSRCPHAQATVHVFADELAAVRLNLRARNGDGRSFARCGRAVFDAPGTVGPELARMYYKTPREAAARRGATASGARWVNYGNPGRRYGRTSYNYLLWNLPRNRAGVLHGGGIVQAVLAQGQAIHPCQTRALTLPAFDARGAINGEVRFRYGRVANAAQSIYGWFLSGYRYKRGAFVAATAPRRR